MGESTAILEKRLIAHPQSRWVFPSPRKAGQHIVKLNGVHDQVCRDAGVSFVLYDLRHTFATRMADAGKPIPTIAAILGHSSLRVLSRYVHPTQESQRIAMREYERLVAGPTLKVVGGKR